MLNKEAPDDTSTEYAKVQDVRTIENPRALACSSNCPTSGVACSSNLQNSGVCCSRNFHVLGVCCSSNFAKAPPALYPLLCGFGERF
eukprot:1654462-Alexandrium_andersonii.AAC.1